MLSHPQGHKKTDGALLEKSNKCALPVANVCSTIALNVNKPAGVKEHFIRAVFCVAPISMVMVSMAAVSFTDICSSA